MKKRSVVLYIATSLDGYIARENGDINWLDVVEGEGDSGYSEFYDTIDTVLMGNTTYKQTFELADQYPYTGKESYVFSRTKKEPDSNVTYITEEIPTFIEKLKQSEGSKIWVVGGAEILDLLMKDRLVDEFIIAILPIIIGNGIPLFKKDNPEVRLDLIGTKRYGEIVLLHYKVKS